MKDYGEAAVAAVEYYRSGRAPEPRAAWVMAVKKQFPSSESSRKKGCPRGAFLGLCEEGLVGGIPPGHYTKSKLNKGYAVAAVKVIGRQPAMVEDRIALWRRVAAEPKIHNSQMDVVVALGQAGMINLPKT